MKELLRTGNPVLISWLTHRLAEQGIDAHIFDEHTAGAYGGGITAIRARVMVAEEDHSAALRILEEAPDEP